MDVGFIIIVSWAIGIWLVVLAIIIGKLSKGFNSVEITLPLTKQELKEQEKIKIQRGYNDIIKIADNEDLKNKIDKLELLHDELSIGTDNILEVSILVKNIIKCYNMLIKRERATLRDIEPKILRANDNKYSRKIRSQIRLEKLEQISLIDSLKAELHKWKDVK